MPLVARLGRSEVVVVAPHERGKHHRRRVGAWQRRRSRRFGRAARGALLACAFFLCVFFLPRRASRRARRSRRGGSRACRRRGSPAGRARRARRASRVAFFLCVFFLPRRASRRARRSRRGGSRACRRRGSPAGRARRARRACSRARRRSARSASPRAWHHGRGRTRPAFLPRVSRFRGAFDDNARARRRRARRVCFFLFFSAFFRPARVSDFAEDLATACSEPGAGFRAGSGAGASRARVGIERASRGTTASRRAGRAPRWSSSWKRREGCAFRA